MFCGLNLNHLKEIKAKQTMEASKKRKHVIKYLDALLDTGDINKSKLEWQYLLFAYDGQQFDMIGCTHKEDIDDYADHYNIFGNNDAEKTLLRFLPLNPLNLPYEVSVDNHDIWIICGDWYIEKWDTIQQVTGVIESMLKDTCTQIDDFAIILASEENYPIESSVGG